MDRSPFTITIQPHPFDQGAEIAALENNTQRGAVVSFCGFVRDHGDCQQVAAIEIEHYPGMTETSLHTLLQQACARWELLAAKILHRIGYLAVGEAIVLVITASAHRHAAFEAAQFIMDHLKQQALFWKKEIDQHGHHQWVRAKLSDQQAAQKWE